MTCECQVTKSDCQPNCLWGMEKSPGFAKLFSQTPGSLGQVAGADQLLRTLNHRGKMASDGNEYSEDEQDQVFPVAGIFSL